MTGSETDSPVSGSEADSPGRPALLAATPSADRVLGWLRTLLLLALLSGLLTAMFALELAIRL